jgi:hypothetical protein
MVLGSYLTGQLLEGTKEVFAQPPSEQLWVDVELLAPEGKERIVPEKESQCTAAVVLIISFKIRKGLLKHSSCQSSLAG